MFNLSTSTKVDGFIAHYNLTEWWLSTFSKEEQDMISDRYKPLGLPDNTLTRGHWNSAQPVTEFLYALYSWFSTPQYKTIAERILKKTYALGQQNPVTGPGYYNGRHFTTYINEVKELKRQRNYIEAEKLLLELVSATESQDKVDKFGVAPWYYDELAKIYRKQKDYANELAILKRFSKRRHGPGVKPPRLIERLEQVKLLMLNKHNK